MENPLAACKCLQRYLNSLAGPCQHVAPSSIIASTAASQLRPKRTGACIIPNKSRPVKKCTRCRGTPLQNDRPMEAGVSLSKVLVCGSGCFTARTLERLGYNSAKGRRVHGRSWSAKRRQGPQEMSRVLAPCIPGRALRKNVLWAAGHKQGYLMAQELVSNHSKKSFLRVRPQRLQRLA